MFSSNLRDRLISDVTAVGGFVTFYGGGRIGVFHNDQEFSLYDEKHVIMFLNYLALEKELQDHDNKTCLMNHIHKG